MHQSSHSERQLSPPGGYPPKAIGFAGPEETERPPCGSVPLRQELGKLPQVAGEGILKEVGQGVLGSGKWNKQRGCNLIVWSWAHVTTALTTASLPKLSTSLSSNSYPEIFVSELCSPSIG